jgi:CheY-like chemotaxis protein/antitoxin component HigA of HigAB toxin-antitoxin module
MANENNLDPQAVRERIGKHLRTADEHTRHQRYDAAITEVMAALKIDPKNNYARSFLERVKLMQKRAQPKEPEQSTAADLSLEERMETISHHFIIAEEYINKKDYKAALKEVAAVYKIDPNNYYARTYSERIDSLMLEESAGENKVLKTEQQPASPQVPKSPSHERGSIPMYRELLKEAWLDGKITEEEAMELATMRELFGITLENHHQLEHEVKIEAYLEALYIAGYDNILTETEQKTLLQMRVKYGITQAEQAVAEVRYDELKHSSKPRATILIVDMDQRIHESLSEVLKQHGYTILSAQNAEAAMPLILKQTPNLILSDLFFKNSPIDGVGFFKKLRENLLLKQVPFIFMSSLKDKKIIHAGLRLGVDYFITKPIDIDLLLAFIEGRLRS